MSGLALTITASSEPILPKRCPRYAEKSRAQQPTDQDARRKRCGLLRGREQRYRARRRPAAVSSSADQHCAQALGRFGPIADIGTSCASRRRGISKVLRLALTHRDERCRSR
jgi:hypothetical protein